jgi:hypothetical protein
MRRPYEGLVSNPTLQDFREKATLMRLAPLAESRLYNCCAFQSFFIRDLFAGIQKESAKPGPSENN